MIADAAGGESSIKKVALNELCDLYWLPVYVFIRRRSFDRQQSEDLTQEFFVNLIGNQKLVESADRELGRFRTFLLAALKNQLANHVRDACAIKRGGDIKNLSVDWQNAEQSYQAEPCDGWTAEALFHRRWALTTLETVLSEIERAYRDAGRADWFQLLKPYLTTQAKPDYQSLATQLNTTPAAARVAVHRLRKHYREALVQQIRNTVGDDESVSDEKTVLLNALTGIE